MTYYSQEDCQIDDFGVLIARQLSLKDQSRAVDVQHNVPFYDAPSLDNDLRDADKRQDILAEWADVLVRQSGVLVLKQSIADHNVIDAATSVFEQVIEDERDTQTGGDHFAGTGANDRIWNALQKLAISDPDLFVRYFASLSIAAVSEAYLGPAYQMTAQVNLVRPGGRAQIAHRDYHLGFMSAEQSALYPAHAHQISAGITLQGAIAHCDMPVISGPTKFLPFSQLYQPGYLAVHQDDFREKFEANFVQLPLEKGDAIFFSPALFHAAGDNDSNDIQRLANLLQVSSAMGRSIESLDRTAICQKLYPALARSNLSQAEHDAVIAAAAEGYAFPTNLDLDPPLGGNASESQAMLLKRALSEQMSADEFAAELARQNDKRRA